VQERCCCCGGKSCQGRKESCRSQAKHEQVIRPFCITILYHNFTVIHWYISYLEMILMLFPLFLHVWWSLEELLPESGFCWKKDHQGTIFWRSGKF
jgi:hypothetical protein